MDDLALDLSERNTTNAPVIPNKSPPPDNDDFDWANDKSIILPEQPETAAYFNAEGSLVIRQRRWPDEDTVIIIAESCLDRFLDKLTDVCGIPSVGKP
jgi:hypothetical protein